MRRYRVRTHTQKQLKTWLASEYTMYLLKKRMQHPLIHLSIVLEVIFSSLFLSLSLHHLVNAPFFALSVSSPPSLSWIVNRFLLRLAQVDVNECSP